MRRIIITTTASLLMLSACGDEDGQSSQSFESTKQMAEAIGCTGHDSLGSDEKELFALEEAECDLDGESMQLLRFAGSTEQDQWFAVAKEFMSESRMLLGDNWIITADDPATVRDVESSL